MGSEEYALGAAFEPDNWLRMGLSAVVASTNVLGSAGSGVGYRVGLEVRRRWVRAGVTYGDADVAMSWRSVNGVRDRSQGTRRFGLGLGTPRVRVLGFEPAAALEWNSDAGYNKASWMRGDVSLGVFNGTLRLVAGLAECARQPASGYREVGIIADVDWLQVQLGARFGADPVPGNSLTFGVGVHGN